MSDNQKAVVQKDMVVVDSIGRFDKPTVIRAALHGLSGLVFPPALIDLQGRKFIARNFRAYPGAYRIRRLDLKYFGANTVFFMRWLNRLVSTASPLGLDGFKKLAETFARTAVPRWHPQQDQWETRSDQGAG